MTNESSIAQPMLKKSKELLGRRIVAFIIDLIILAIIGYILSLIGKGFFVELGNHGVLVGSLISTIYYAVFNSETGNGKSPGKRAMHLEVVKSDGSQLTFKEGLIRSLLFTTPFFLLEYFQNLFYSPIVSNVLGALNIAYYVGLFYFFVVNADRRTVHDIVAQTIVKYQNEDLNELSPISKTKIYFYVGIIFIILGGFIATYLTFKNTTNTLTEVFEANREVLEELATEIYDLEQVVRVESSKIHITVESEVGIVVEAWVSEDVNKEEAKIIYEEIMDILVKKKFNINRIDYSEVVLNYGYDIGIFDHKTSRSWISENDK